jgi:orotate phosphoribosyltransferase
LVAVTARERLIGELRTHAIIRGDVALVSGAGSEYYVDVKRAILRPAGFAALSELMAQHARSTGATAVGGLTSGAHIMGCAAIAGKAPVRVFFVRDTIPTTGVSREIEGAILDPTDSCLVVKDIVTSGGMILRAIDALQRVDVRICGVCTVLDRLAGGRGRIEAATSAPFHALTTIDEVYPDRPDRATDAVDSR